MNEFSTYFYLGLEHILDIKGIDHILFVITLCAVYQIKEYKKVLVLVTAFTLGHSVTLALSALNLVSIDAFLIELLIPITIFITAAYNVLKPIQANTKTIQVNYVLALGFGLIHGLGFSNFFKAMMIGQDDIIYPLFCFNIGIEIGQLLVVGLLLISLYVYQNILKRKHYDWNILLSGAGGGIALNMIFERVLEVI